MFIHIQNPYSYVLTSAIIGSYEQSLQLIIASIYVIPKYMEITKMRLLF